MSDLINEQVKEEFKRFFEYAFRYNPKCWQELPGWEVLGKEAARTQKDTATLNRLISSIAISEQHLKRIINDSSLDPAQELKYYAYLFLKDMGKAGGLPEIKLPEIPAQFAGTYDNPNRLLDMVMDSSRSPELRQQALKWVKELMLWSSLPDKIFDREVFHAKKWEELKSTVQGKVDLSSIDREWIKRAAPEIINGRLDYVDLYIKGWIWNRGNADNLSEYLEQDVYAIRDQADQNDYNNRARDHQNGINARKAQIDAEWEGIHGDINRRWGGHYQNKTAWGCYTDSLWNWYSSRPLQDLEAGGGWKTLGWHVPVFLVNDGLDFLINLDARVLSNRRSLAEWQRSPGYQARTPPPRGSVNNERVSAYWQAYRKEQDEEYPSLLVQYEKSLEPAKFPEHAVVEIEDISGDKRYVILRDKIGEAKASKLWSSREKLLDAISGKFSGELKNIFASRLCDISIITASEQNKIIGGLGESHEYMFWGDSMNIQVVDPSIARVNKNELFAEEKPADQDRVNQNKENADL